MSFASERQMPSRVSSKSAIPPAGVPVAVLLPPDDVAVRTIASYHKQRRPVAQAREAHLRGRVKHLQEELAAESATNIEFEENSRRSFEYLTGQVKVLKGGFDTLTDTLLGELERISASVTSEVSRVDARQGETHRHFEECVSGQRGLDERIREQLDAQRQLSETIERLERGLEQLAGEMSRMDGRCSVIHQHLTDCTAGQKTLDDWLNKQHEAQKQLRESWDRPFEKLAGEVSRLDARHNDLHRHLKDCICGQRGLDDRFSELCDVQQQLSETIVRLERRLFKHLEDFTSRQRALDERLGELFNSQSQLGEKNAQLESRVGENIAHLDSRCDRLASDLGTVMEAVPKMEDAVLRGDGSSREKFTAVSRELDRIDSLVVAERSRSAASTERLDAKIKGISADLMKEMEQRQTKTQVGLAKQLEGMSRAMLKEMEKLAAGESIFGTSPKRGASASARSVAGQPDLANLSTMDLSVSAADCSKLTPPRASPSSPRSLGLDFRLG